MQSDKNVQKINAFHTSKEPEGKNFLRREVRLPRERLRLRKLLGGKKGSEDWKVVTGKLRRLLNYNTWMIAFAQRGAQ